VRRALLLQTISLLAFPTLASLSLGALPIEAGPPFACNQVNLHPGALSNGQVAVAHSSTLWLTPANAALQVTATNVTGTLPAGLSFVPGPNVNQVTLVGTPTATGVYTFTVELGGTYVLGTICKTSQTYTVTIVP
jgi:hypothetical protein